MISRLTVLATVFAILGTASLAYAANARQAAIETPAALTKPVRIVQLEPVVITAKRLDANAR
ncbi:MAG: hypothetical protein V4569_18920 [Pseudomonadota bacterium]